MLNLRIWNSWSVGSVGRREERRASWLLEMNVHCMDQADAIASLMSLYLVHHYGWNRRGGSLRRTLWVVRSADQPISQIALNNNGNCARRSNSKFAVVAGLVPAYFYYYSPKWGMLMYRRPKSFRSALWVAEHSTSYPSGYPASLALTI